MRPRLLDLFCGAGGAAVGYHRAGFDVIGVDIAPQPNYPFEFFQGDALEYLQVLAETGWAHDSLPVDAIHASPPCQFATAYGRRPGHVKPSLNLIPATRALLEQTGLPYVIENVEYARPWLHEPLMLCGSSFGLDVRRHRLFETSWPLVMSLPCAHGQQNGNYPQATNRKNRRKTAEIGVWRIPLGTQKQAMGVDWDVTLEELSEMIPPDYTRWLGSALMQHIGAEMAA